MFQVSTHY